MLQRQVSSCVHSFAVGKRAKTIWRAERRLVYALFSRFFPTAEPVHRLVCAKPVQHEFSGPRAFELNVHAQKIRALGSRTQSFLIHRAPAPC